MIFGADSIKNQKSKVDEERLYHDFGIFLLCGNPVTFCPALLRATSCGIAFQKFKCDFRQLLSCISQHRAADAQSIRFLQIEIETEFSPKHAPLVPTFQLLGKDQPRPARTQADTLALLKSITCALSHNLSASTSTATYSFPRSSPHFLPFQPQRVPPTEDPAGTSAALFC